MAHETNLTESTFHDGDTVVRSLHLAGELTGPDDDIVDLLVELLGCSRLEAEHVHTVLVEDGAFITSVYDDIAGLPSEAA